MRLTQILIRGLYFLSVFVDFYFRMGDIEPEVADAPDGVDAAAITATNFVPDASGLGNKSSLGSESAMQDSSNVQEESTSVDHRAIHGACISESMYVTTENGSISSEAQINSSGNSATTILTVYEISYKQFFYF